MNRGIHPEHETALYWTTRDGQRIRPEDMTFSHRQATMNMLIRDATAYAERAFDSTISSNNFEVQGFAWVMLDYSLDEKLLFDDFVAHRPVFRRMAELNGLIEGRNK